ncbi:MAG: transposase [Ardenticatenaceae bacterium]
MDVVVRIGWLRQEGRYTYAEIQQNLAGNIQISLSHLRYLYQRVYLPLLACHERLHKDKLDQIAKEQGGLIITLDGLVPEAGQPQIWFMRELSTGLTLRSGWIGTFDQDTFVEFLWPLKTIEWPILSVLSDKQKGLLPAMKEVLPDVPHQFCQPHFLRNLAEPLSTADSSFKVELRKSVRSEVGELIRSENLSNNSQSRLLTMTGLFPDNESPESKSEDTNQLNNDNKSTTARRSTETPDVQLPHLLDGNISDQMAPLEQKTTLKTNNTDKDSIISSPEITHEELLNTTSSTNSQGCKNEASK